jgi:hypothetical protein
MPSKLIFLLIAIGILLSLTSLGAAKDSYSIADNQIIFSISSSNGIFHTVSILQENTIINTLELCDREKCAGNLKPAINLSELEPGKYQLNYYSFDDYEGKELNFTINNNQNDQNNNPQDQTESNNRPLSKMIIVTTICRLSSLIKDNYQECRNRFLS